jgi:hypothetical protein
MRNFNPTPKPGNPGPNNWKTKTLGKQWIVTIFVITLPKMA